MTFGRKGLKPGEQSRASHDVLHTRTPKAAADVEPHIELPVEKISDTIDLVTDVIDLDIGGLVTSFLWDKLEERADVRSQGSEEKR